jgi:hypothetical protein
LLQERFWAAHGSQAVPLELPVVLPEPLVLLLVPPDVAPLPSRPLVLPLLVDELDPLLVEELEPLLVLAPLEVLLWLPDEVLDPLLVLAPLEVLLVWLPEEDPLLDPELEPPLDPEPAPEKPVVDELVLEPQAASVTAETRANHFMGDSS